MFSFITRLFMTISTFFEERLYPSYREYPVYPEANLWTEYTPQATTFKLWSPVAEKIIIKIYQKGNGGQPFEKHTLKEEAEGLWMLTLDGDLQGIYYTFRVRVNGNWLGETPGIYATAVGVNGKRAMVLGMASTNPVGWASDKGPAVSCPNAVVLYEAHVRDLTVSKNAGSTKPGKFLGLTEKGTTNTEGLATGLDHMKELGITHVHLLPAFDFNSVDEAALHTPQYNWGYDPQNYNVPEGSYASDPFHAEVRIREFKEMVKGFHDNGLGVVLDVVYNHTGLTEKSNFNLEVPGYYYRQTANGKWSNASGCGNETASERAMVRKFIIESCKFWAREYHIDGFRFDLMAIHDIETMNLLAAELKKINPDIIIYGEGWTGGASPLPDHEKALKVNTHKLKEVAAFSDDLRDALKGSVFDEKSRGFVSGAHHTEESIKFGVAGSTPHPQVDRHRAWAREPWQAVSYVSCHDNQTLYDKLKASNKDSSEEQIKQMHLLAQAVVLTSQGIPFLMAGEEMLRTKKGAHNSYNLPDAINQINWTWKSFNRDVFDFYRNLIALRKAHPAFYMPTSAMLHKHLEFTTTAHGIVGFLLKDHANNDTWKNTMVYYNANMFNVRVDIPGEWRVAALGTSIDMSGKKKVEHHISIPPVSMLMLFQE
jgi:pullulanase